MSAADPRLAMLAQMREPAFRLGMAFAAEAERADDLDKKIAFFHLFDRCGFAVRVGIALELRLERTPAVRPEPREAASDRETLIDREDLADRDPPEGPLRYEPEYDPEYDRERDRETERASLPILLRTLEGVVADAEALPGPPPAELITLRDLIAHARSGSRRAPRPQSPPGPAPAPKHLASNVGQILAARRATGPPRRF